jgi:predicted small lipoprotein YifL
MTINRLALLSVLALAGCGQSGTNPPTDPAAPINTPEAQAPPQSPPPGVGSIMPGSGPQTFVGRWAANAAWCANTQGAERPIEITTTRFEGYENSCGILSISQVSDGYQASLACTAEGQTANERIRMAVQGDAMRLTWLNRNNAVVSLVRCAAPAETPPPS